MKKIITLAGLVWIFAHSAMADQLPVFLEYHRKITPEKNTDVNRSLAVCPIGVYYDSITRKIETVGDEYVEAEIFLYDADGTIIEHSSSINTEFTVSASGAYIILTQGNGWYAEGKIEVD